MQISSQMRRQIARTPQLKPKLFRANFNFDPECFRNEVFLSRKDERYEIVLDFQCFTTRRVTEHLTQRMNILNGWDFVSGRQSSIFFHEECGGLSCTHSKHQGALEHMMIIKRDGTTVPFDATKIVEAVKKAFLFDEEGRPRTSANNTETRAKVDVIGNAAAEAVLAKATREGVISLRIEDIQDQVELALMRSGEHAVARGYVIFRERRANGRNAATPETPVRAQLTITRADGTSFKLDSNSLLEEIEPICAVHGTPQYASVVVDRAVRDLYDGATEAEMRKALLLASRANIERDPVYVYITAGILLNDIRSEVFGDKSTLESEWFPKQIKRGIEIGMYNPEIRNYDLGRLGAALKRERDNQFGFMGLQTLYDRYLVVDKTGANGTAERRIETPQGFMMRVAMGLALNEVDRDARAIEFYDVLSKLEFMSSTPTLFNAATRHPQMSSCYLSTVGDDLEGIYDAIKENALLQKFAGGIGNDWTPVRSMGALIKGTNGESQGVIPFLKVVNDTAVAVNQGGKRKGAVCSYLETWHMDIEEFLDLRKNTGDDRRRTHDMNTANWIPDLFMERVMIGGTWTLFSPSDVPDLHDLYGEKFRVAYAAYEEKAARGEIKLFKTVSALDLWRKMLTMLFETGHPWVTFKDPCNLRSPQQHVGVVHSSNLCTEITLNTGPDEIAVCNLGSVNLVAHMRKDAHGNYELDREKIRVTVRTAMRMLDNVIDINYYGVKKARTSNLKHRPVGMGLMGFQDALHLLKLPYSSKEAVRFASESTEVIAYEAYFASSLLAEERGRYSSYAGSLWDQDIMPQDSLNRVTAARMPGMHKPVVIEACCDWNALRAQIKRSGMRNSNCVAIAPTATISNIVGVSACIEPSYENLFVKSNLSGEFTVIDEYLVRELKALNLWDDEMIADLKFYDGSVAKIARVPLEIRALFTTAFENDATWYIEAASARQTWIDQAQSLNIYVAGASGKKLNDLYRMAWVKGLKSTYYLRSKAATNAEKSTGRGGELNAVPTSVPAIATTDELVLDASAGAFCSLEEVISGSCESCQ